MCVTELEGIIIMSGIGDEKKKKNIFPKHTGFSWPLYVMLC